MFLLSPQNIGVYYIFIVSKGQDIYVTALFINIFILINKLQIVNLHLNLFIYM